MNQCILALNTNANLDIILIFEWGPESNPMDKNWNKVTVNVFSWKKDIGVSEAHIHGKKQLSTVPIRFKMSVRVWKKVREHGDAHAHVDYAITVMVTITVKVILPVLLRHTSHVSITATLYLI